MSDTNSKFVIAILILLSFFGIVLGRLVYLQLFLGPQYMRYSESYTVREIPVPTSRGRIFDRNGILLADTRPAFDLFLDPARLRSPQNLFKNLAPILQTTAEALQQSWLAFKSQSRFRPIVIASDLNATQITQIRAQQAQNRVNPSEGEGFSALEIQVSSQRYYPMGEAFGHPLGYLSEISEDRLKLEAQIHPDRYFPGDLVGVQGIERRFDLELRGIEGKEQKMTDAVGREVGADPAGLHEDLEKTPPIPGNDLYLTLDAELQKTAFQALGKQRGAVVVMSVKSGEVLTLVSRPAYDPEKLGRKMTKEYWASLNQESLQQDDSNPFLNRATQGTYPPGSTFKIITGIAGLAEKLISVADSISCPGYYQFGERKFGCWLGSGHGGTDFYRSLVQSCDVYFYKLGEKLGIDRLATYARMFGLGESTGIELDFEREGLIPDSTWNEMRRKQKWKVSQTLNASIGQGDITVTPLQNAVMIARVAGRGKKTVPRLLLQMKKKELVANGLSKSLPEISPRVDTSPDPKEEKVDFISSLSKDDWKSLIVALKGVVHDSTGTAHKIRLDGITMAGKTGTAQVVDYSKFGRKARSRKTEDHAWFVAFTPVDVPEIALSVIVEHGGHGGAAAAPIAQKVIRRYYEIHHQWKPSALESSSEKKRKQE